MIRLLTFLLGICFLASCGVSADLLIVNGSVMDGSGSPAQELDVAVRKDRILRVGPEIKMRAKRVIDAEGKIVSPGFVDIHAHIEPLTTMPEAESHVRQGVTTALGGPDGGGPLPLGKYLDDLEEQGVGMNVAYLVGHNSVRNQIMGLVNKAPTEGELKAMEALVAKSMQEGAFGISTGLKYLPGTYAKLDEIIALSRIAAREGGIYTSHLREEGLGLIEAVSEAITISEKAEIPVVLTHHKAMGQPMWGKSRETLAMVDAARSSGLDIMMDQYPYTASHTGISVLIPAWALEGHQITEFTKRCEDPVLRDSIKAGIMDNLVNDRGGGDLRRVQFSRFNWKPELEGKTLYDWAVAEGREPNIETGAELVIEAQLHRGANCIFHAMDEQDVRRIMQHPFSMVASDGRLSTPGKGHPHPRAYGTFPRVLGYYSREEGVLPLEEAVRKMTSLPAQRIGLPERGMIREGNYADITIFDPATVKDEATFEDPHQYPTGIEYVIINGKLAVDNGVFQHKLPGEVLRKKHSKK
ncbi:N-acyl-D-amino-acid deacylase family protein [Flavilitoribacter nigricans]|uniref:Aminoacylase n=1 Tax=Flavilitoribacter nigricans (strain ATCC 23147 / DSM 23189 / NBRC 102662 / NCIMB 1420 / SS-2) TaxID=1122177 RepID=A0A2D0MZW4_FLAN2|nr:D-aminoacylase [Flavilitoribacter nigricans]PHN00993.1 aminoacylase [Flavilitoribacter nigricans DSM 23189 = NBRC 102662]